MQDEFKQINNKLDRISDKLDNHLERIAVVESDVNWLKGHVKVSISSLLAVVTGAILYWITGRN